MRPYGDAFPRTIHMRFYLFRPEKLELKIVKNGKIAVIRSKIDKIEYYYIYIIKSAIIVHQLIFG